MVSNTVIIREISSSRQYSRRQWYVRRKYADSKKSLNTHSTAFPNRVVVPNRYLFYRNSQLNGPKIAFDLNLTLGATTRTAPGSILPITSSRRSRRGSKAHPRKRTDTDRSRIRRRCLFYGIHDVILTARCYNEVNDEIK